MNVSSTLRVIVLVSLLALPVTSMSRPAYSLTINPGFDLIATGASSASIPGIVGTVSFVGRPIDPTHLGNADTIIQRSGTILSGNTGTIPTELIALSLKSTGGPYTYLGNPSDVFVIINKPGFPNLPTTSLPASTGTDTITSNTGVSGTFDSTLDLFAEVFITIPGGDPNIPADVTAQFPLTPAPVVLNHLGGTWDQTPPANYPVDPTYPNGDFYVSGDASTTTRTHTPPVGGEIIPIDMTALFVAGVMTNASWMIPTLGGVTGATIAFFKVKRKRE